MKTQTHYRYLQDPGHGWIEVPRAELDALGIADQITHYSYERAPFAYLEEDCDAGLWLKARDEAGHPVSAEDLRETHTNNDSFIRALPSYRRPADLRTITAARLRALLEA
jgi:hypothetical protein